MAQTETLVQLHKKGDATALIYGQTVAEGVKFTDGENLQAKLNSLVNKIEIVKIGNDALVIGQDKSVTIPEFYTKSETDSTFATKEEVSAIPKFGIEVVETLPTTGIKNATIYLVVTGEETDNLYTEYIRVNNKWEKLGTQKLDISGKQDVITDLETIRAGATKGASALQPSDVDQTYNAISTNALSGVAVASAIAGKANSADLATVATSGSYNDLTNKPTVDQTYGASSANAQSGVAVAGAINALDYVEYTVIKTL